MNNLYKEAMDEINISDQCLRKVKSMNNNNKKIKKGPSFTGEPLFYVGNNQ